MKTQTKTLNKIKVTILTPDTGKVLTLKYPYKKEGKIITEEEALAEGIEKTEIISKGPLWLGKNDSVDNWVEIDEPIEEETLEEPLI